MADVADVLEGWSRPAAVLGANGALVAANALFRSADVAPAQLQDLKPGERLETPDAGGGAWIWSAKALPQGERLLLAEAAVMQGLNARERYLAALSHELRTPLNGVLGMAGLLSATRLDADQRAYVNALKETGAHLLHLVNDVLDLAKLESGQIDLELAPVDVELLLQGVCELLSPRAHEKGLQIAWAAPAGLPRVLGDEGRLRQILFNLAGNAVKFTQTGGALLQAWPVAAAGAGVVLRFSVTDTGPGVAESEQGRIFEEYVRGPGEDDRLEGAGLGLAIVRRLAAAHKGSVGLNIPPASGSQFWFEARFDLAEAQGAASAALAGLTIAVASPNPIVREAAALQVRASGGQIWSPGHIETPAVALFDRELIEDIAACSPPPGPPAIVLLTPEQRGEIAQLRARGFAGYLIKPLRRASLTDRILAVANLGGRESLAPAPEDERIAPASAVGLRVLLAEDNPINALLARTLLEREGCAVECAGNGIEAVSAALAGGHDLILMDVRMPGMDGLSASRALRARGADCPIIALTADAFEDDRKACLAAGMDDFLAKPLEAGALRTALARWAGGRGWTGDAAKDKLVS